MSDFEKVRKPRQTRGTPSYRYRNYFAVGVIAVSTLWGLALHYSPAAQKLKNLIQEGYFADSEDQKEKRRMMLMFIAPKSVETLKKSLEDENK